MIISHRYKFIFIAIPKTGTHAVRSALRPSLGPDDWEQVQLHHQSRLPIDRFKELPHGHITGAEIKPHLPPEVWREYLKFSVVRDPVERFISACFFKFQHNKVFRQNPLGFMHLLFESSTALDHLMFKPQAQFLCDEKDLIVVDQIARTESLEGDLNGILNRLGLPSTKLVKANVTQFDRSQFVVDGSLKQRILQHYHRDFELIPALNQSL